MKKIIALSSILFLFSCVSMNTSLIPNNELTDSLIITDLKETQNQLFVKSNKWLVNAFKSAKAVSQFSDKESGVIVGRYSAQGYYFNQNNIQTPAHFLINIEVKDYKAKIQIKPHEPIKASKEGRQRLKDEIKYVITNYKDLISKPEEDW